MERIEIKIGGQNEKGFVYAHSIEGNKDMLGEVINSLEAVRE